MRYWMLTGSVLILAVLANAASAQVLTKTIGATYIEAPPSRDQGLVPHGLLGAQEKAEVFIVATFPEHVVSDGTFFSETAVLASAVFEDGTSMALGGAENDTAPRLSADMRSILMVFRVGRLPDKKPAYVDFTGTVKLQAFSAQVRTIKVKFEPRDGAVIRIGAGDATVTGVQAAQFTLKSDAGLRDIARMRLISNSNGTNEAKRAGYSLGPNGSGQVTWLFDDALSAGDLEISLYERMQKVTVPINARIVRPF